jgi:hypothetical protein
MKRNQNLEANTSKSYAFLWEQCAKGMQSKSDAGAKLESTVQGNPIELLKKCNNTIQIIKIFVQLSWMHQEN